MIETAKEFRFYRKGPHSYQLAERFWVKTGYIGAEFRITSLDGSRIFAEHNTRGLLVIEPGYWWDGPSGPGVDTDNFMPGSCVHDVWYQAGREGDLPQTFRDEADDLLDRINARFGMSATRRWWVKRAVNRFSAFAFKYAPEKVHTVKVAA